MICPLHRTSFTFGTKCSICEKEGIVVISSEFDKQDRIIDTLTYDGGHVFMPTRSRAILVFKKGVK